LKSAWLRTTASTAACSPVGVFKDATALTLGSGVSPAGVAAGPSPDEHAQDAIAMTAQMVGTTRMFARRRRQQRASGVPTANREL